MRAIRESAHEASALGYRDRLGIAGPPRIGVVLQRLVIPDCAGVLFTQNPLDGRDERVIEASWGLGEAVVAGLVTPDRYRVSRDGRVVERTPGTKSIEIRVVLGEGTREEPVAAERARALCLEDARLHRLHTLACRCEEVFGGAQDLEWAFAGESLHLLHRARHHARRRVSSSPTSQRVAGRLPTVRPSPRGRRRWHHPRAHQLHDDRRGPPRPA